MTIFEKLIICPFFMLVCGVLVARDTLKNSASKKSFLERHTRLLIELAI